MKLLLNKTRLNTFGVFLFILLVTTSNKAYPQFNYIIGFRYTPTMSFSNFADNQYVSHAWDLNSGINYMPTPLNWFLRVANIRTYQKFDFDFEIGISLLSLGYGNTITGNYNGGEKWMANITESDLNAIFSFPIDLYILTKPTIKNYRKYLKIGATILYSPYDFTSVIKTRTIYPDANPLLQDTFVETSTTYLKEQAKITLNFGIGIEKIFKQKYILDLGLVYNQGFSTLMTTDVAYTIDGIDFKNKILNKGSYLGIELSIANNLSHKKTKKINKKN